MKRETIVKTATALIAIILVISFLNEFYIIQLADYIVLSLIILLMIIFIVLLWITYITNKEKRIKENEKIGYEQDNIYVVDKAVRRIGGMASFSFGPLVVTPHAIYFISLVHENFRRKMVLATFSETPRIVWDAYEKAMEEGEDELKKLGIFLQKLDNLVLEKENSLKINKLDIELCKIPQKYILYTGSPSYGALIVKTRDEEKYEIRFWAPKKTTPALIHYFEKNYYPLKVTWGSKRTENNI